MGVLYTDNSDTEEVGTEIGEEESLRSNLRTSNDFTTASALALLVFALLYTPCIATIAAIGAENGRWWAVGSVIYSTAIAWLCAYIVYHLALLFQ